MCNPRDDWGFGPGFPFGGRWWAGAWQAKGRGPRRRSQMLESGEVKFVILRLLKEKPRHGYEVIKGLEVVSAMECVETDRSDRPKETVTIDSVTITEAD